MKRKRLASLEYCFDGDILAQDVFSKNNALLVTENTKLNYYIIQKLKEFGIDKVYICRETGKYGNTVLDELYKKFEDNYDNNVNGIKSIIKNIAAGKKLEYGKVLDITESLYEGIGEKNNIIECLSTIKNFDQYTYNHSINVALYSMLTAKWLKFDEKGIKDVIIAGMLHDIGKSQVPINVLNKKGKLDDNEFEIMKQHPALGYNLAKTISGLSKDILDSILMHHEREDGNGYPSGLTGNRINLISKIISLADVYDALTSERVYKKRITPFETFQIIERTGWGHFDVKIMLTFLHNIASYYIGAEVVISGGKKGKIAYVVPHNISMPIVEIDGKYVDMSKETGYEIIELVN